LIKLLQATFSNPDEVGTASGELEYLMKGNYKFTIYYAEFQHLIPILDCDSKAKKANLNWELSKELQASLIY
jgi:hypothetical protein